MGRDVEGSGKIWVAGTVMIKTYCIKFYKD